MNKSFYRKAGLSSLVAIIASLFIIPSVAMANTTTTTVSSTLSPTISLLTSDGTVNINAIPTGAGVQTVGSDTVTVSTNDAAGYTLKIGETTATATLTNGGNTIPASSGTQASPVAEVVNTWGYCVPNEGGFGSTCPSAGASNQSISNSELFAAVPATASPNTIASTSTTATNATTMVWYGVAVNTSTPSGTYTNSVTYTATAN